MALWNTKNNEPVGFVYMIPATNPKIKLSLASYKNDGEQS